MSDEVREEPTTDDSEEDAIEELTIEERQEALKRARWNVFMYLGLAALLFGFALYPFMSTTMDVDEGIGSTDKTITVWGLPVAGEDFTDIPVEIDVTVKSLPTDVNSIEIFIIENSKGCESTDGSIGETRSELQSGESKHPNQYHIIEDPVESETYSVEMSVDPGIYCVQVVVDSSGSGFSGINVKADVALYPTQLPLAVFAALCLLMSGFAFIGAQKHGKHVKSLVEPKKEPSIEDSVLAETSAARIAAGPSGPPTGPTGPPAPGPTGPPAQARQVHLHSKRQWRHPYLSRLQNQLLNQWQRMYTKTKEMVGISENSQTVPTTKRCTSSRMDFTFPTKSLVLDLAP